MFIIRVEVLIIVLPARFDRKARIFQTFKLYDIQCSIYKLVNFNVLLSINLRNDVLSKIWASLSIRKINLSNKN